MTSKESCKQKVCGFFVWFLIRKINGLTIVYIDIIRTGSEKEWMMMSRRKSIMSQGLKEEIAKELGFYDVVQKEGWGGITAKDAGNMVKRAVEMAQQNLQNKG
ncbi:hypothetical protein J2S17_005024 [Cytobacillus purgationiresistens]|uniref:Small acid-soluble spore protein F (Minor alpha/beta-type SASP) n=2 Tax=Cytobacillus purgationiresistens TaxID=863449 RepID=A0ABU0AP87_9BACI|nr:hypothetical protein [Cytobacillus purgationiresistens]